VLALCLTVIAVIRYCMTAQHADMGCDIAGYLSTMDTLFGLDVTGFGLLRPPLSALPLKVFALALGDVAGAKMLGIILSMAIAIPFYLLAKRVSRPWIAAAMSIVFVLTPAYSDMLSWGYLTMFGIFFTMLTLYFFILLLEKPSIANAVITGACASFIVGSHQLSLAFALPLFVLIAAALFVFNREGLRTNAKAVFGAVVLGIALSMIYLPIYLRMIQLQAPATSEPVFSLATPYSATVLGTVLALPLIGLSLKWTGQQHKNTAIVVGVLLAYSLILTLFRLPPPFLELNRRAHYFMYPAVWLLAGVVLSRLWSWRLTHVSAVRRWLPRGGVTALIFVLLSATTVPSFVTLHRGLEFFGYLDDTRWDAVRWITDNTPRDASIAAYPEPLGWWTEAKSDRNTAAVTDRTTVPYQFLRERSLAVERLLSRNQGLENGSLRLATTWPYGGAAGQPVLGVCVGGFFHDTMMLDERTISVSLLGGEVVTLAAASPPEFAVTGTDECRTMITRYRIDGATIIQEATLRRGSQTAVVSYAVQNDGSSVAGLEITLLFSCKPAEVSVAPDQRTVEVVQFLRARSERVLTQIGVETAGAAIQSASTQDDRVHLSFSITGQQATITFSFVVTDPTLDSNADVIHYQVPQTIRDPALDHYPSIDYLAIDLKPNPQLASALPWPTEEWLNACPYYKLVYSEGDIRIYEVDLSALP
jgi:hypothetical protein